MRDQLVDVEDETKNLRVVVEMWQDIRTAVDNARLIVAFDDINRPMSFQTTQALVSIGITEVIRQTTGQTSTRTRIVLALHHLNPSFDHDLNRRFSQMANGAAKRNIVISPNMIRDSKKQNTRDRKTQIRNNQINSLRPDLRFIDAIDNNRVQPGTMVSTNVNIAGAMVHERMTESNL
jgi:hypothetical protein